MPRTVTIRSRLRISVTPRFEIFYALRALDAGAAATAGWRRRSDRLLPEDFSETMARVAPHPLMWPLLADALRDGKPGPDFSEIVETIRSADDRVFQESVLGGIFRDREAVAELIGGHRKLDDAARVEAEAGRSIVALLGLYPFDKSTAVAMALSRVIDDPAAYRADLAAALDSFWTLVFGDTWRDLGPAMDQARKSLQSSLAGGSPSEFARDIGLPVALDDRNRAVTSLRGSTLYSYSSVREIHVIPSAFNDARLWAAYADDEGSVRLFFPVYRPELLREDVRSVDAAMAFRALGDTTRYAMASVLAHEPQTSVELAKAFGVSKATISHHVQLLRAAGLLDESSADNGIVLSLNRQTVEGISAAALRELYGGGNDPVIRRSRRQRARRS